jgi:hypothetical protein
MAPLRHINYTETARWLAANTVNNSWIATHFRKCSSNVVVYFSSIFVLVWCIQPCHLIKFNKVKIQFLEWLYQQDRQCTYNVTLRRIQEITVAVEKHIGLCVHACRSVRACGYADAWACACAYVHVALLMQHATRMRPIVTSFVAPRSTLYFSTLSHKRCDFLKKVIEHEMCVFIFSTTFVYNISHSKKNLARYCHKCENVFLQSTRYFVGFKYIWIFSTDFRKSLKYKVSSKSVLWKPSYCMRTDGRTDGQTKGQTDVTKLIVAFRNFANAPNKHKIVDFILTYIKSCYVFRLKLK